MRKIPTLFVRDWDGDRRYVLDQVTPGCEWVTKGEGSPTQKIDGTCVMADSAGRWWARREVKPGKARPDGFVMLETDEETGKMVGWEPVEQSAFARWHAEAAADGQWEPGTYELIGPKVNGNPEGEDAHRLVKHEYCQLLLETPRDFEGLRTYLHGQPWEGIVWHHPDGRMVKIKKRDFREPA